MASSETLRAVLDAGSAGRRLDELSTARVILKIAEQVHSAQQKAGAGKAVGPLSPAAVAIDKDAGVELGVADRKATGYSAPEQLDGGDGDRRSDVWSIGVVMWEALTGEPLFEGGDNAAIAAAVRQQTIDPPATRNANIPNELSAICMRALSRNPADRYQSAKVMAAEVEAVLDDAGFAGDDRIKELIADLPNSAAAAGLVAVPDRKPPPEMLKVPLDMSASQTAPGVVIPRGDDAPKSVSHAQISVPTRSAGGTKPPSILDKAPTEPPSSMTAVSPGSLEDSAKHISPTSFLKPPTQPPPIANPASAGATLAAALANAGTPKPERIGMQTLVHAAVPAPQQMPARGGATEPPAIPEITAPADSVPMAPVLPKASASATVHGFTSGEMPKTDPKADAALAAKIDASLLESDPALDRSITEAAKAQAAKISADNVIVDPNASNPSLAASANAAQAAKSIYPGTAVSAGELRRISEAPTVDVKVIELATSTVSTLVDTKPKPEAVAARTRQPTPNPASVVALPAMAGRESQEVLGGWGWGTDSHPAIKSYEGEAEDDALPVASNRKTMIYVFGGLFAAAAIVVVVAMSMAGSKKPEQV
ncbi:MAG TPA: protein kinase, partial [Kofleriaceae bacterium]